MKQDIAQVLPERSRHWSWDPDKAQTRTHRQMCIQASRKGLPLEVMEKRRVLAAGERMRRRLDAALGAALFRALTGEKPEIRKVKSVTVTATVSVKIDFEEEGW